MSHLHQFRKSGGFRQKKHPGFREVPRVRHSYFERLEDRTLLDSQPVASLLNGGVLRVVGTDGDDVISIRQDLDQISVANISITGGNAVVRQVPANLVTRLEIFGLGGNDVIRLDQGSEPIFVPAAIDGGPGEDFIVGGDGNDEIHGGDGQDAIWGGGGTDIRDGELTPSLFSESVRNGLTAVAHWVGQQKLPLVGGAAQMEKAFQRGLIDPVSDFLINNDITAPGFEEILRGLSMHVGDLTVTVDPASVSKVVVGNTVCFALNFEATLSGMTNLESLGESADTAGFRLDPSTTVNATSALDFALNFGIDQTPGLSLGDAFILKLPTNALSARVTVDVSDLNAALDVGFLDAEVHHGTIQLDARATLDAIDEDGSGGLSLQELQQSGTAAITLGSSLVVNLPVSAQLGSFTTSGVLSINEPDLFHNQDPTPHVTNLNGWQDFTSVGAANVMGCLHQLAGQLGQLGSQVWTDLIPFTSDFSMSRVSDLGQAFRSIVTNPLAPRNDILNQSEPEFATAQELAVKLAQALGVNLSQIGMTYDEDTHQLTYRLVLDYHSGTTEALNVDLNQGGLSNAALGDTNNPVPQWNLASETQANLTFGLDMTRIGHGFVLQPNTPLASLNGGTGVRTSNSTTPDLRITLPDNTSIDVDLDGAVTVQDVISIIQTASAGKLEVSIDSDTRSRLVVRSDSSPGFSVSDISQDSPTATDLGIAGADAGQTGEVYGRPLHGDSWEKHFFLEDVNVNVSVDGSASHVAASADLSAIGLQMTNGSGSIHMQGGLTLQDPGTVAADGHIVLRELGDALKNPQVLGSLVGNPTFSGSAHLSLPVQFRVSIAGFELPIDEKVLVDWTDITDPSKLALTVTPPITAQNLTISVLLTGLDKARDFLVDLQKGTLFQQDLPLVKRSLADLVNPAERLDAALRDLHQNPPTTVDQLISRLGKLLGHSPSSSPSRMAEASAGNGTSTSFKNKIFEMDFSTSFESQQSVPLNLDLPNVGQFLDVSGSAPLDVNLGGTVNLGLVIDLNRPTSPVFYLKDTSQLTVQTLVTASDINFDASVGPLGLFVHKGAVRLDNGTAGQPATWTVALTNDSPNRRWLLSDVLNHITTTLDGQVSASLPVFFPTEDHPLDWNIPNLEFHVADLAHIGQTTTLVVPNFQEAINGLSLGSVFDCAADGWSGVLQTLRNAMSLAMSAQKIPVVGKQLKHALDFLQEMDEKVLKKLENATIVSASIVQDALYEGLGPQGLNWLQDITGDGQVTLEDVGLETTPDGAHYRPKLHADLFQVNTPIDIQLGLDGLGLQIDGNLCLKAGFDVDLGFGVSRQDGFYLDATDSAQVTFNAQLPASATGELGFFVLTATPAGGDPEFVGSLGVSLNDPNGNGRMTLGEMTSRSALQVTLDASADVDLLLMATFGGNLDLPHIETDFQFHWSLDPSVPTTVGFSHVKLDLGGFIDVIAEKIGDVLKPIKPAVDLLSAPLPVLSQLAGGTYTLVDLARDLGTISSGTADFIEAVVGFVNGTDLGVPAIDLGSFTLDANAVTDPAQQGRLNPISDSTTPQEWEDWKAAAKATKFEIPVLEHPMQAFKLLLGQDVPLVEYTMPKLDLHFGFSAFFPIVGPLGAELQGELGARAQFSFGFDTSGFREFMAGDFRDPSLILDGLYVGDESMLELYGSIAAYAALNLAVAKAGVGGGIFASADFRLNDPNQDGRVTLPEFEANMEKGTIFYASGALDAFLNAFVEIKLWKFKKRWSYQIASVKLGEIGEQPKPSAEQIPELATLQAGVLRLNVGPYASYRLYGDTSDGDDSISVTPGSTPDSVIVHGFGLDQTYSSVAKIVADGGQGNDSITLNAGDTIDADLVGGDGDDSILVVRAKNVVASGGAGNDTIVVNDSVSASLDGSEGADRIIVNNATSARLEGGDGNDVLTVTGLGSATLHGNDGADVLYGGSGAGQELFGDEGEDWLYAGSGSAQVLHGGVGIDRLLGISANGLTSGTAVQLFGDEDDDFLYGGTGPNQTLDGGADNDQLFAGEADGQKLLGGQGNDLIQVGWHFGNDGTPQPGSTNKGAGHNYELHGGSGNDTIYGGEGNDTLYGENGADALYGQGGDDVLWGGLNNDVLHGGRGNDTFYGGLGNDTLLGDAGDDQLHGDAGTNVLWGDFGTPSGGGAPIDPIDGSPGNDTFFAGVGQDVMRGEAGNDTFQFDMANVSSADANIIDGGPNRDVVVFNGGDIDEDGNPIQDDIAVTLVDAGTRTYDLTDRYVNWVRDNNGNIVEAQVLRDLGTVRYNMPESVEVFRVAGRGGDDRIQVASSFTQRMEIDGGDGNDVLIGGGGLNTIWGGAGDDLIIGGPTQNEIHGGAGKDTLVGGAGSDSMFGEDGNDNLIGGPGTDFLYGGAGDDLIIGDSNLDYGELVGNGYPGTPPISEAAISSLAQVLNLYHVAIRSSAAGDILYGDDDPSAISGGNDVIFGSAGEDVIFAAGGNDWVNGRVGLDIIDGGAGNDTLNGGGGYDRIFGGTGADRIYATRWDASVFSPAEEDVGTYNYLQTLVAENNLVNRIQVQQTAILDVVQDMAALDLLLAVQNGYIPTPEEQSIINAAKAKYPLHPTTGETTLEQLENLYGDDQQQIRAQIVILLSTYSDNLDIEMSAIQTAKVTVMQQLNLLAGDDAAWNDTSTPGYVLVGGDGDDTIYGSAVRDVIDAGSGSDSIHWSPGNDAVFGGTDPSSGYTDASTDSFVVAGTDQADIVDIWSEPSKAVYVKFMGLEARGSLLAARQDSNTQVDHLGIEKVALDALGGDDYVTVATAYDAYLEVAVDGGDGNDYLNAGGTAGRRPSDTGHAGLVPAQTNVTLVGGAGDDKLIAGNGSDHLYGGNDTSQHLDVDLSSGATDNDVLIAGGGSQQVVKGGVGDDTIKMGSVIQGDSVLDGGSGYNELHFVSSNGNELVAVSTGSVRVNGVTPSESNFQKVFLIGGSGTNTFSTDSTMPNVVLQGGSGTNELSATGGSGTLIGGDEANNILSITGAGNYTVIGGGPPAMLATPAPSGIVDPTPAGIIRSTAMLSQARGRATTTTVGMKAMIAGGSYYASGFHYINVVDIYNVSTGQWSTATLSQARDNLSATTVGTTAIFAGGWSANGLSNVVDIYNASKPSGQEWSTATLSQARNYVAATTVGTKAIFAGGYLGNNQYSNVVDIYDASKPPGQEWSTATLSQARLYRAATTVGTKAIFSDGSTLDIYDISTGLWSTATLSQTRSYLAATTVGTKAIFAGGLFNDANGSHYSNVVDIYDSSTGNWSTATLSQARHSIAAATVGTRAIFAGGDFGSYYSSSNVVDIYDYTTGQWSTATLSQGRDDLLATAVGAKAIFAGGASGFPATDSATVDIFTFPSSVAVDAPTSPVNGNASIIYTLVGEASNACTIQIQCSVNGGPWQIATPGPGGDGTDNLSASAAGTTHTFVWDTLHDLGNTNNPSVRIRIAPTDAIGTGATQTSGSFAVNNTGVTNTLTIRLDDNNSNNNNSISLAQRGSTITFSGTIVGVALTGTATNITTVSVIGGAAKDLLDASGMVMPVTLDGGTGSGADTLIGGAGCDTLYYSGTGSSYDGGGGANNEIVYRAANNDIIALMTPAIVVNNVRKNLGSVTRIEDFRVSGTPLSVNNGKQLIWRVDVYPLKNTLISSVTAASGSPCTVLTASFTDPHPFASVSTDMATIDWGDGIISAGTVMSVGGGNFTVTAIHIYATKADHVVLMTVVNSRGAGVTVGATYSGGLQLDGGILNNHVNSTSSPVDSGDSSVASFVVRNADLTVFTLHNNGHLYAIAGSNPIQLVDSNIASVVLGYDDTLYALRKSSDPNVCDLYTAARGLTSLTFAESSIRTIVASNDGILYMLESNGQLYEKRPGSDWGYVSSSVQWISLNAFGTALNIMETRGAYWLYSRSTWTLEGIPHFSVSRADNTTAGVGTVVTVSVFDVFGIPVNGYTWTLHFSSTDAAATLPADYSFTAADAGSHTFPVTFFTAGTQTLTVTGWKTSAQTSVTVSGATASSFNIIPPSDAAIPGAVASFTISALDAYGNVADHYTGTAILSSSDAAAILPGSVTFAGGQAGFTATMNTAGLQSISVTDTASSLAGTTKVTVAGAGMVNGNLIVAGTVANESIEIISFGAGLVDVLLNGIDLGVFILGSGSGIQINARGGDDLISVSGPAIPISLDGSSGNDRLDLSRSVLPASWNLSSADAGTVGGIAFSGIENLTGSSRNDSFQIADSGSLSGQIDGAGGYNTLDYSGSTVEVAIDVSSGAAARLNGNQNRAFANIQSFVGSQTTAADSLYGPSTATTYTLNNAASGSLSSGQNYSGFERLIGNGHDMLVGPNSAATWNVAGTDAGTLTTGSTSISFSGIKNLIGGSHDDLFMLAPGSEISGTIDGGGGVNVLDYSAYGSSVMVRLQDQMATATGGFNSIQRLIGANGTGTNILVGTDAATRWTVSRANGGMVNGLDFDAFQHLIGGAGDDTFTFTPGGSTGGTIDGGNGLNALDYSAYGSGVSISLLTETAAATGGIHHILKVVGTPFGDYLTGGSTNDTLVAGGGNDTLIGGGTGNHTFILSTSQATGTTVTGGTGNDSLLGPNSDNSWVLSGVNGGMINGCVTFSNIKNLKGGQNNDSFKFNNGASLVGTVDGGAGVNILDYSTWTPLPDVDTNTGTASNLNAGGSYGFSDIDIIAIEPTAPAVGIASITPNPRVSPVDSITVHFSKSVTGCGIEDMNLTRDGIRVCLTGATLTTSDLRNWTLGNLSALTSSVGNYQLTLVATESGISDFVGNALTGGANIVWQTMQPLAGDFNCDTAVDGLDLDIWKANFGINSAATRQMGDGNGDGAVDGIDLDLWKATMGMVLTADTIAPTVSIAPITPNPRVSPVDSIMIKFSEPIAGLGIEDLQFTLNGFNLPLTGATLTTSDLRNWTLGNLSALTSSVGNYQLTLVATESGISDFVGNALTGGANIVWQTMQPLAGDFNCDTAVDGLDLDIWKANFGINSAATRQMGDGNGDGAVDGIDLDLWKATMGMVLSGGDVENGSPSTTAPQPRPTASVPDKALPAAANGPTGNVAPPAKTRVSEAAASATPVSTPSVADSVALLVVSTIDVAVGQETSRTLQSAQVGGVAFNIEQSPASSNAAAQMLPAAILHDKSETDISATANILNVTLPVSTLQAAHDAVFGLLGAVLDQRNFTTDQTESDVPRNSGENKRE
jgi:Ca2+-binding RTX toxin-like protein